MTKLTFSAIDPDLLYQVVRQEIRDEFDALRRAPGIFPTTQRCFLTERQAVDYTGLSRSTLQRNRQAGRLPVAGLGRAVRYRRTDLDAFMGIARELGARR